MFKKERGFTLIELLIVIAIIGILAAAILPRFISFDTDARLAADKGSLSSLRAALVLYRAKTGVFPRIDGLKVLTLAVDSGPYIEKIPVCQVVTYGGGTADPGACCTVGLTIASVGGWMYLSDTDTILVNYAAGDSTTW